MPRITLDQMEALPDVITGEAYELLFGTIPGGIRSEPLTLKCLNTNIPGFGNETFEVPIHGHVLKFRGRKTYPRILQATLIETTDLSSFRALRAWHEFIVGSNSGGGLLKKQYSVNAELRTYGPDNQLVDSVILHYCFPTEISDTVLDGQGSQAMQIQTMFSYDYFSSNNHVIR